MSAALILTLFGAALFLPPLVLLLNGTSRVFGVPVEVIYLFTVWFGLVAGTAALSMALPRAPAPPEDGEGEP